jgi:hypothetical protein
MQSFSVFNNVKLIPCLVIKSFCIQYFLVIVFALDGKLTIIEKVICSGSKLPSDAIFEPLQMTRC